MLEGGGYDNVVVGDWIRKVSCGDKVVDDDGNDDDNVGVDINDGNNAVSDSMKKTERDHNCSLIFWKHFWSALASQ